MHKPWTPHHSSAPPLSTSTPIFKLPIELIQNIFSCLSAPDLLACRLTCSQWMRATSSRNLLQHHTGILNATEPLGSIKRRFFTTTTSALSPSKKLQLGLGWYFRSVTELHRIGNVGRSEILLADGDAMFFLVRTERTVYIYRSFGFERKPGYGPLPIDGANAMPPHLLFEHRISSPVVAFLVSRGLIHKRAEPEDLIFMLLHESGDATIILGHMDWGVTQHVVIRDPCKNEWTMFERRQRKVYAAALTGRQAAFLSKAGTAVYKINGFHGGPQGPKTRTHFYLWKWIPPSKERDLLHIVIAGFLSHPCETPSKTLIIPCHEWSPELDSPQILVENIQPIHLHEPEYSDSPPPLFLRRSPMFDGLGQNRIFPFILNFEGNLEIVGMQDIRGYRPSTSFIRWGPRCLIKHPLGKDGFSLVDYKTLMINDFEYLIALCYADGEIWLYELHMPRDLGTSILQIALPWPLAEPAPTQLEGTYVGQESQVQTMGFAVLWLPALERPRSLGEQNMDVLKTPVIALVVVTKADVVVTWNLTIAPKFEKAIVEIEEEEESGSFKEKIGGWIRTIVGRGHGADGPRQVGTGSSRQ